MGRLARFGAAVAVVAVVVAVPVSSALGAAGDWGQFKYSAAENPFNAAEKTISTSNVGSLQTAWARQFPTAKFIGVPVVSGSHVVSLISGGVISLKAATGKTRWRVQLAGTNSGRIASDGDAVYVATSKGQVYALDAATGAQRWVFSAYSDGVVVSNGTVYLGGTVIYAIDATTGQERWHFTAGWDDAWPVVANGTVYTRQTDLLVALDAATGAIRWTVAEEMPLLLYKTSLYALWGLHSLDPTTGAQKWWNQDVGFAIVAANGRVYGQTGGGDQWAAINAGTGHILWTRSHVLSNAALANGVIYVNEDNVGGLGTLRALDATTGTELATLPGHLGPIVSHGVVYTVGNDLDGGGAPTLYALKP